MPGIRNLMIIAIVILMLFGILGVTFFKGKFYYCDTENLPHEVLVQVATLWDCYDLGGEWERYDSNFDNVVEAMITMFNLMTTSGWVSTMLHGIDATAIHQAPKTDKNFSMSLFFVLFLIMGSLFVLNLFVAVVVDTFF